MIKNILIIGDSLGAKRPDGIQSENRWPNLLANYFNVTKQTEGSSTTNKLKSFKKKHIEHKDLVIIQLGIVDCVPRLISKNESFLLARCPKFVRIAILRFIKKYRVRSINRAYVDALNYQYNFESFISKFIGPIIIIKILEQADKFSKINREASKSIRFYNLVIDQLVDSYDNVSSVEVPKKYVDRITLQDGYHLNSIGHRYLFRIVKLKIMEF
jgi:acyl-CoA thioesterase-1